MSAFTKVRATIEVTGSLPSYAAKRLQKASTPRDRLHWVIDLLESTMRPGNDPFVLKIEEVTESMRDD